MSEFWWNIVNHLPLTAPIALISGLFSGAASFCIIKFLEHWHLQRTRRRLIRARDAYVGKHGTHEVALAISAREDIRQAATDHLNAQGRGDMELRQVFRPQPLGKSEEDWDRFLEDVKMQIREIRKSGANRIYLFTNLPVAMAIFAGATLTNGPEVIVHHYESGHYRPVGRLTVETVRF